MQTSCSCPVNCHFNVNEAILLVLLHNDIAEDNVIQVLESNRQRFIILNCSKIYIVDKLSFNLYAEGMSRSATITRIMAYKFPRTCTVKFKYNISNVVRHIKYTLLTLSHSVLCVSYVELPPCIYKYCINTHHR